MHGNRFNQNTLNTEITDGYTRVSDLDHYATLVYRQAGRMSPLYPCTIVDTGEVFLRGHDVFAFQKVCLYYNVTKHFSNTRDNSRLIH